MIEFILIIGLLYVLGIVLLLHIMATSDTFNRMLPPEHRSLIDPSFHPWFMSIEAIIVLSITYIFSRWFV